VSGSRAPSVGSRARIPTIDSPECELGGGGDRGPAQRRPGERGVSARARGPGATRARGPSRTTLVLLAAAALAAGGFPAAQEQENETCLGCHETPGLELERDGRTLSLAVDGALFAKSAHGRFDCSSCHTDLAGVEKFPHAPDLAPVDCTECHDDDDGPVTAYRASAHAAKGVGCAQCHAPHAAGTPQDDPRSSCAGCHAQADQRWRAGAHGPASAGAAADCVDCHGAHAATPGGEALHPACALCHAETVSRWRSGVHAGDPGNGHVAADCGDCHGGHDLLPASDLHARVNPLHLPDTCESCHRPEPSSEHPAPGGEKASQYETSVHGQALRRFGLVVTATCSSCHGAHDVRPPREQGAPTSRHQIPTTCGKCHAGILQTYLEGVHGADFLAGGRDVPVCNDCHTEHAVRDPAMEGSRVSKALVADTCARCHADDELARRYGFKASVRRSWGESYHGIAGAFGDSSVANCASCHGFHEVLPSSDPRSPVNVANLDATCGRCHPGATAAFARVPVHSLIEREANPVPFWVRTVYAWLVGLLIGAFVLCIAVDLFGRLRLRLGWGPPESEAVDPRLWPDEDALVPPGERFPRMGRNARLQHGLLIVSFSLLVLTGLPVFLHDTPLMRSLIDLEGGFALRSRLHRLAALVLVGLSVWHVLVLVSFAGARGWAASMIPRPRDVLEFLQDLGFSLGLLGWVARSPRLAPLVRRFPWLRFDRRPRLGRYGLVEKLEYGAVLWGNLVMIGTGTILWRPDWFLGWTPAWTFDVCRVVHGFEATLAFLAIIIWHMYHVHLRPGVFPMSRVWLDGRISRAELRQHHPGEYLALLERRRARGAAGSGNASLVGESGGSQS